MKPQGLLVLLALLAGFAGGYLLWGTSRSDRPTSHGTLPEHRKPNAAPDAQEEKDRLKQSEKNVADQLTGAVKLGRISKEKARRAKQKIAEAYAFRKDLDLTTAEDRARLREARKQWRAWAAKNDVPYYFFMPLR